MLEQCKNAKERWGGVSQMIDNWLNERQQLIVLYYNLSTSKPLSDESPLIKTISEFCQVMMDYCSAGHFEIYEQLINEAKDFDDGGIELAQQIVPRLDAITSACVDFNDDYDQHCEFEQLAKLPSDVSNMGELLEERFQLEDRLIERLHTAHRDLVTEE